MASGESIQRGILPIPDRKPVGLTTYDARDPDTTFPPITPVRPPPGAPNVLIMLLPPQEIIAATVGHGSGCSCSLLNGA